jgi:DNA-binding MarR family transcriptional regulator
MTLLQTQILLAVMDAEGSSELTQPELAKRFETTVASVSRSIDKLALGTVLDPTTKAYRIGPELLKKFESTADFRTQAVRLSERGRELRRKLAHLR